MGSWEADWAQLNRKGMLGPLSYQTSPASAAVFSLWSPKRKILSEAASWSPSPTPIQLFFLPKRMNSKKDPYTQHTLICGLENK